VCGIYGAIKFTEEGAQKIRGIKPLLEETSKLRGRDGHGSYEWEWGYLGVSRAQPLPEAETTLLPMKYDNLTMVFNGTLSNDGELIREWNLLDDKVDTWTAIQMWGKFGWKCCEKFVGGFAFGVYDEFKDVFVVAKNFKTLWYINTKDYFVFASEKEFLLVDGSVRDEFEEAYPRRFPQNTVAGFNREGKLFSDRIKRKFWSHTPDLDLNKAVIVISGGIDSSTSAYIAKKLHSKEVFLLNFDYGQRSSEREWEAVQCIAESLESKYVQIDLRRLGEWGSSPLTDKSIELPLGMQSVESTWCWTPARNMLMIAYAAAYAEAKGIKWIYYGNNLEEEATGYSDNDLEFVYLYNQLLDYGTLKGVKIKRALGRVMKPEILHIGNYLGVPYRSTWSCDEGFEIPCGICGCCTTRRYAFLRAGFNDEQKYLHPLRDQYPWIGSKSYDVKKLLELVKEE